LASFGGVPQDFFSNPAYLEDERFVSLFTGMGNTPGFMPQLLHDTFDALARGHMMESAPTILAHWKNSSTINVNGVVMRNPAIESLDEVQIATLDLMSEAVQAFGPDRVAEAHRAARLIYNSPAFDDLVKRTLDGQNIGQFLSENVPAYLSLHGGQRSSAQAVAAMFISMSQTEIGGQSGTKWLKNRMETHLDRMMPDSGGKVVERDSDGFPTTRTQYDLRRQLGDNAGVFETYIMDGITELAPSRSTNIGPRNLRGDIGSLLSTAPVAIPSRILEQVITRQQRYLQLVPIGPDSLGGISYRVFEVDPETAMTTEVPQEVGENIGEPLIFSTAEPEFKRLIQQEDFIGRARELQDYQLKRQSLSEFARKNTFPNIQGFNPWR
jgi:hypothetical protein